MPAATLCLLHICTSLSVSPSLSLSQAADRDKELYAKLENVEAKGEALRNEHEAFKTQALSVIAEAKEETGKRLSGVSSAQLIAISAHRHHSPSLCCFALLIAITFT